jgi:hypothetical protein
MDEGPEARIKHSEGSGDDGEGKEERVYNVIAPKGYYDDVFRLQSKMSNSQTVQLSRRC